MLRRPSRLPLLLPLVSVLIACGPSEAEKAAAKEAEARQAAFKEKYAKAEALFKERCKTAGVVVKRTVKDVEGIELTKIRQPIPWGGKEYFDPMYPGAAMADESSGRNYVWQFLQSEFRYSYAPLRRGTFGPPSDRAGPQQISPRRGYRFVEYHDPTTGKWIRCQAKTSQQPARNIDDLMSCDFIATPRSSYALDFEDIVDSTERESWIAGTTLKVVDKQSGEVIGQLNKYVWDAGFGASATGRWPWAYAGGAASTVCPGDPLRMHGFDSRYFVDTILIPIQGD